MTFDYVKLNGVKINFLSKISVFTPILTKISGLSQVKDSENYLRYITKKTPSQKLLSSKNPAVLSKPKNQKMFVFVLFQYSISGTEYSAKNLCCRRLLYWMLRNLFAVIISFCCFLLL